MGSLLVSHTGSWVRGQHNPFRFTRHALALGINDAEADAVLTLSDLTGHGGEPVVESEGLADLLAKVREGDRE
jgi:hypothetical protein